MTSFSIVVIALGLTSLLLLWQINRLQQNTLSQRLEQLQRNTESHLNYLGAQHLEDKVDAATWRLLIKRVEALEQYYSNQTEAQP